MNSTPELRSQAVGSVLKGVLNSFPVVGPIVVEMIEWNSKIKQERLNNFIALLEVALNKSNIDLTMFMKEESIDLFETIVKKVIVSRGEQKVLWYKNLLLRGTNDSSVIDYCEIFSEILYSIRDVQLLILKDHCNYLYNDMGALEAYHHYSHEVYSLKKEESGERQDSLARAEIGEQVARELVEKYGENCTAEKLHLSEGEYLFFLQDLYGKGLLKDDGIGAIETRPFELMSITAFGQKFLSFIE